MSDSFTDPVVAEIHAIRATMLEAAGGDIKVLMEGVGQRQRTSKHPIITKPFRDRGEHSDTPASRRPIV